MKNERQLIVISLMQGFKWGGSEALWYKTVLYAISKGVSVSVFIKKWEDDHPKIKSLRKKGVNVNYYSNVDEKIKRKIFLLKDKYSLLEKISDLQLKSEDVILINQGDTFSAYRSDAISQILNSQAKVCVISQHLSDVFYLPNNFKLKVKQSIHKLHKFFFVSNRSLNNTKRYLLSKGVNFKLVNNPVNLKTKIKLPFPDMSTLKMGVVGRLDCRFKGQDILFEVLSHKKWKQRDWICNVYGDGPDIDYLKGLVEFYDLKDNVKFKGFLEDVASIWSENHLLVLPSISEGTPLSLVEAHLSGRAAVACDVGGVSEVLINNETGWLAEAPLPFYLDKALEKAWLNKSNLKEIGLQAHKLTLKRYNLDAGMELFNQVFDK